MASARLVAVAVVLGVLILGGALLIFPSGRTYQSASSSTPQATARQSPGIAGTQGVSSQSSNRTGSSSTAATSSATKKQYSLPYDRATNTVKIVLTILANLSDTVNFNATEGLWVDLVASSSVTSPYVVINNPALRPADFS